MSKLIEERLLHGPIAVEELLAEQKLAEQAGDEDEAKFLGTLIRDCWGTPPELFEELNRQYQFTIDCAAEPWNAKLPRYYGVGGECHNAFDASLAGETWFCNPPFSAIAQWMQWLWSFYKTGEPRAGEGVLLIPATRTEQKWWEIFVEPYRDNPTAWAQWGVELRCKFLPGRTHYVPPPGVSVSSPRFGSCLLTWRPL